MMEFNTYAKQYFLSILQTEFKINKKAMPPISGVDWLDDLVSYLFSEYDNSHDELYEVGLALATSTSFDELKEKLGDLRRFYG